MSPLVAIIAGFVLLVLIFILLMPSNGILARWNRNDQNSERILMEDILKYIYDCEYKSIECDIRMVSINLNTDVDKTREVLENLYDLKLVLSENKLLNLTKEGREYALRVIRVHRVWERYLADETGVHEMEWHPRADDKEHYLSVEEANKLAASMGNPVFDPHGDPIPSATGNIPSHKGKGLNQFLPGDLVNVLHVEDEPSTIYAQLVALGLHAHMNLKVISVDNQKIRFMTDTEELILANQFAENLTCIKLEFDNKFDEATDRLSNVKVGESAKIIGISLACRGQQRRRLMDFGVIPGAAIKMLMKSPTGEPHAYQVMGATIAFRKEQADMIFVKLNN